MQMISMESQRYRNNAQTICVKINRNQMVVIHGV